MGYNYNSKNAYFFKLFVHLMYDSKKILMIKGCMGCSILSSNRDKTKTQLWSLFIYLTTQKAK